MASLFDRVSRLARGPQGQSMLQKAMNRFGGGQAQRTGRRAGRKAAAGRGRRGRRR